MTDVATIPFADVVVQRRRGVLSTVSVGLLGGLVLGAIARAWMRLIADDPDFTWSGTIFIVAGFTIFGLTQSIAAVVRGRAKRRWTLTIARAVGAIGLMPLFVGAGAIMLPTVVGGGFALNRTDWRRSVRVICVIAALGPVLLVASQIVGEFGWSLHTLAGIAAFLAIYGTIIAATRFTFRPHADGWQLGRRSKLVIFAIPALILCYLLVGRV